MEECQHSFEGLPNLSFLMEILLFLKPPEPLKTCDLTQRCFKKRLKTVLKIQLKCFCYCLSKLQTKFYTDMLLSDKAHLKGVKKKKKKSPHHK